MPLFSEAGGDVVPHLISALRATDDEVRVAACTVLASTGDRRAVQPLIALLDDGYERVRLAAIAALRGIGEEAAAPLHDHLVREMASQDMRARSRATAA